MADVKNVITLGIGATPTDIRFFVLVGLDISPLPTIPQRIYVVPEESRMFKPEESRTWALPSESRTHAVDISPLSATSQRTYVVPEESRMFKPKESRTWTLPSESRTREG